MSQEDELFGNDSDTSEEPTEMSKQNNLNKNNRNNQNDENDDPDSLTTQQDSDTEENDKYTDDDFFSSNLEEYNKVTAFPTVKCPSEKMIDSYE